jgi:hypothetical protein
MRDTKYWKIVEISPVTVLKRLAKIAGIVKRSDTIRIGKQYEGEELKPISPKCSNPTA